ncbi:hypothetical protein B0J14DRAFT_597594, partial [Halenospora varia]
MYKDSNEACSFCASWTATVVSIMPTAVPPVAQSCLSGDDGDVKQLSWACSCFHQHEMTAGSPAATTVPVTGSATSDVVITSNLPVPTVTPTPMPSSESSSVLSTGDSPSGKSECSASYTSSESPSSVEIASSAHGETSSGPTPFHTELPPSTQTFATEPPASPTFPGVPCSKSVLSTRVDTILSAPVPSGWNTIPISSKMMDCYNSLVCQDLKFAWHQCVNIIEESDVDQAAKDKGIWNCLCGSIHPHDKPFSQLANECGACITGALPPGGPRPAAELGPGIKNSTERYCQKETPSSTIKLVGKVLSQEFWLPFTLFDVQLVEGPKNPGRSVEPLVARNTEPANTPGWNTLPISIPMLTCLNTQSCQDVKFLWHQCIEIPKGFHGVDAASLSTFSTECLCNGLHPQGKWWINLVDECSRCVEGALPPGGPHPIPEFGNTIRSLTFDFCFKHSTATLMDNLGEIAHNISTTWWLPFKFLDIQLVQPINGKRDPQGSTPEVWNTFPASQAMIEIYHNIPCTASKAIWNRCVNGEEGDKATGECLCGGFTQLRHKWGDHINGCAFAISNALPAGGPFPANNLTSYVKFATSTYCAMLVEQRQTALIKQIGGFLSDRFWLPIRLFDIELLKAQPSTITRRSVVDDECEAPPPPASYGAPSPTTEAFLPPTTQAPPPPTSFASTVTSTTHIATSTNSNLPPIAPWNTLPISDKMNSCYDSAACQNPKKLYNYCKNDTPDRGDEIALQKCLCKDLGVGPRTWQTTVIDCLTCMAEALPASNGEVPGSVPQPANTLVQNATNVMNFYCTANP